MVPNFKTIDTNWKKFCVIQMSYQEFLNDIICFLKPIKPNH